MPRKAPYCEGAKRLFIPDIIIRDWDWETQDTPENGPFAKSIVSIFGLPSPPEDKYVYTAGPAKVTLLQSQSVILAGGRNGLHAWYRDAEGNEIPPPPEDDIVAFADLFDPSKSLKAALSAFQSNAKKGSRRHEIAHHLSSNLLLPRAGLLPNKAKRQHKNPYYDFWRWSCRELEWGGPFPNTANTKTSHHILPIFYHHFGCVVPSYAALYLIAQLAQPKGGPKVPSKPILDVGSGCGYWSFMLRSLALPAHMSPLVVHAIDNQRSLYRTMWVGDTIAETGVAYLDANEGGKDAILLLVYPQTEEDFVPQTLEHYKGDVVVVAATQNEDGFTALKEETMDAWMKREHPEFEHTAQIPLPSFAGKDEALYVFERRKDA